MVACLLWGGKAEPAGAELRGRAAGAWEPTVPFLQLAVLQGSLARFLPALLPHRQSVPAHLNSPDRPEPFPGGDEKEDPTSQGSPSVGGQICRNPLTSSLGRSTFYIIRRKQWNCFLENGGKEKQHSEHKGLCF